MEDAMFCPRCGTGGQTPESYCRKCGIWLQDLTSGPVGGIFRPSTRKQRIRRMRSLQSISIGLSLTSAVIILSFLWDGSNREMLSLAALCGILVAVYQIITLFIGNKVLIPKQDRRAEIDGTNAGALPAGDTTRFVTPDSVTSDTTELLEPARVSETSKPKRQNL